MNTGLQTNQRFLELLEANRPKILKVCRVYAWNPAEQDDLYQDILLQIWRALPTLMEESHVNTWLYRIALNTAFGFVRKQMSHRACLVPFDADAWKEFPELPLSDPDQSEQLAQLFNAISQLGELEKAAITLFLEDLSYEQIADVMGISESNVGVLLHRAKKKLSTLMKEVPCTTTR